MSLDALNCWGKASKSLGIFGQTAIKSKQPEDNQDYRVIAISEGPLTLENFASVYREFSVGTMSFTASSIGERSPWVTIGPFTHAEQRQLAIIRQDWTDRQDKFGRPVAAQCCLCLPENELVQCAPSYTNLFSNLPNQRYFLSPDQQLLAPPKLALKPLTDETAKILHSIEQFGFEFCSYVAAMLLVSPVAVMGGQELSVDVMLSFFDAVASLLPYGSRTDLSVSTWMSSTSVDKIRLGFSGDALPYQKRVVWLKPTPKEVQNHVVAAQYYKLLNKLWTDPDSDKKQIISDLANQRNPHIFGHSESFLDALREINWEKAVYEAVINEQGKKEEVRALLNTERKQALSNEQLQSLCIFLLKEPDIEDLEILRENWSASLAPPACASVERLRSPVFQTEVLWSLCQLAAEKGWLDKLLEPLLGVGDSATLKPLAELYYRVICQLHHDTRQARRLLLAHPKLACEFLSVVGEDTANEEEAERLLLWLRDDDSPDRIDFILFRIALGLTETDADAGMIEDLAAIDEKYVESLVNLAANRARRTKDVSPLGHLAPGLCDWLMKRVSRLKPDTEQWREPLKLLQTASSTSIKVGAKLDLLVLALFGDSSDFLSINRYLEEGPEEVEKYGEEFARILSLIEIDSQPIIQNLIKHLDVTGLESPEAVSKGMQLIWKILPRIKTNHVRNLLIAHVKKSAFKHPLIVADEPFFKEFKEHLLGWNKDQQLLEILQTAFRAAACHSLAIEEVVGLYIQMLDLESSAIEERVMQTFSETNYLKDPETIELLLQNLQQTLEMKQPSLDALAQTVALKKQLLRIDSEPVRRYRASYEENLIKALEEVSDLLSLLAEVLHEEQLQKVRRLLETMLSRIPSKRFWGRRR